MKITKRGQALADKIERLENPKPALEEIGKILQANTLARILFTKKGPDNKAWPAWAPSTAAARAKKGTAGHGLLYDSGNLANSIKFQVQGKQVIVGSDGSAPYGVFLQEGTPKMPARPFIGVSKEDQAEIHKVMVNFLRKGKK